MILTFTPTERDDRSSEHIESLYQLNRNVPCKNGS